MILQATTAKTNQPCLKINMCNRYFGGKKTLQIKGGTLLKKVGTASDLPAAADLNFFCPAGKIFLAAVLQIMLPHSGAEIVLLFFSHLFFCAFKLLSVVGIGIPETAPTVIVVIQV